MTKSDAITTIYQLINSTILDSDLEDELAEICNCIADDEWEEEEEWEEWEEEEEEEDD